MDTHRHGTRVESPAGDAAPPLPDHESYTSLMIYEDCPRRYAFHYVERLKGEVSGADFAFGSAVHQAFATFVVERIRSRHENAANPGPEVLDRAWDAALAEQEIPSEIQPRLRTAAVPVLARFLCREADSTLTPVAAELGFGVDVALPDGDRIRFTGYVDRVDRAADGSTVICDYKTGRARSQGEVDADRQLTAYAYAAAKGALRDPDDGLVLPPASRLSMYFADHGIEVFTTRTREQIEAFESDLVDMAIAVRARRFHPQPLAGRCRWCEYARICPDSAVRRAVDTR